MWTQKFCLICIYILRNYAFQISNEALFLAFLQPGANRLKSFILPSNRMGKTSSASTFSKHADGTVHASTKGQLSFPHPPGVEIWTAKVLSAGMREGTAQSLASITLNNSYKYRPHVLLTHS